MAWRMRDLCDGDSRKYLDHWKDVRAEIVTKAALKRNEFVYGP